jgi:hypothetical protein
VRGKRWKAESGISFKVKMSILGRGR